MKNRQPLRLLLATASVALAAGLVQPAAAQPGSGPGGMGPGMGQGMGPGMGHGMGHGMGMGPGMGMAMGERVLDAVKATPEQRTQIRQILKAAADDLRAQHEAGRKLHQDMQAAFAQPTVDANAIEVLRKQMLAQHDTASKRMTQAMIDASRVLTPEQRKALADRMTQRRAMMERHRAEREALDKPAR